MAASLDTLRRRPRVAAAESFVRELGREFTDDRVTGLSAEVAFWWVFTLFPALLVVAGVLGLLDSIAGVGVEGDVEAKIVDVIADFTGSDDSQLVNQIQDLFEVRSTGLLTVGAVLAIWSSSRSFTALIYALDAVYDLDDRRGYVRVRALALLLAFSALVAGSIALTLIVVGPLLGRGDEVAEAVGIGSGAFATGWNVLRLPVAALVLVVFHGTIYHYAPNHHTPWRWDLPGAVVAAGFWGLSSWGFRLYLSIAGDASLVFGVLGGALTLMLWLYLLAIGMLVGGEVNAILAQRRGLQAPARTERHVRRMSAWLHRRRHRDDGSRRR